MNYLKDGERIIAQSAEAILFDPDRGGFFVVEDNAIYSQPGLTAENAPPVPATITKLQLTLGMVLAGLITPTEGEAMAEGTGIPTAILDAINVLPTDQRPPARIQFKGMTIVERASPLLTILMAQASPSISDAEMDAYFIAWDQIQ